MKSMVTFTLVIGLLAGALFTQSEAAETGRSFKEITGDTSLIQTFQVHEADMVFYDMAWPLLAWPSEESISGASEVRDRSSEFPTTYPESGDGKPITLGASTPEDAAKAAASHIKSLLKPEWCPKDLSERIILVQDEDPSKSTALVRYEVDGTRIQVVQSVWAIGIVIQPRADLVEGLETTGLGAEVFQGFFNRGNSMANEEKEQMEAPEGITLFAPDTRKRMTLLANEPWEWKAWYTDGKSVAVLFSKNFGQRHISPNTVWF